MSPLVIRGPVWQRNSAACRLHRKDSDCARFEKRRRVEEDYPPWRSGHNVLYDISLSWLAEN